MKNQFIKEIKLFELFSKTIWPIYRLFVKKYLSNRCNNCLISEKAEALNKEGICKKCQLYLQNKTDISNTNKNAQREELNDLLEKAKNKGEKRFDALILFSGGKDSTLLIHKLRHEYPEIRCLTLTVDNTFMSPIALENIKEIIQKLDVPHMMYRPPAFVYNKMFSHAFLNTKNKGCSSVVDQFDGDFIHDIARNIAYDMKIPYVISGCSATQVNNLFNLNSFKFNKDFEEQKREQIAGIKLQHILSNEEMKNWWDGSDKDFIPRVIFPFYVWDFDEDYIKNKVLELGLINPRKNSPLLTNNQLIPLMGLADINTIGYSSFEPEFCRMIREGKTRKENWGNVFEMLEYSAKSGKFISSSANTILERLNLTKEQIGIN